MTTQDFENIIEHQVKLQLEEKGMRLSELSKYEYLQWRYDIALRLLSEL